MRKTKYQITMDYLERKNIVPVYRAIRSQIRQIVEVLKQEGLQSANAAADRQLINEPVYKALLKLYKRVGVTVANMTYEAIEKQVGKKSFGFNAEWTAELIKYFELYILNKATFPITETTRNYIKQVLIKGEQEGWGVDLIARKLLETGVPLPEQITMARARMIVRTEGAKAAFKGREMAKEKTPYELKTQWVSARDHRTRHSHYNMDGVVVNAGEKFVVARYKRVGKVDVQIGIDLMDGPGDPTASKENVINCRCTTVERVVFENNIPVMKRKVEVV